MRFISCGLSEMLFSGCKKLLRGAFMRVILLCLFSLNFVFGNEKSPNMKVKKRSHRAPASISSSSSGSLKSLKNLGLRHTDIERTLYSADLYQDRTESVQTVSSGDPKIFDERVGQRRSLKFLHTH